jgi:riboflavin transporter FmnP
MIMMKTHRVTKTYNLVAVALFAAASALFQVLHNIIGIPTGFGMTVDLVALPVLLAFFIFGFEEALNVCVLMAILITLVSPETWLGASMKFAATLPMILLPALWLLAGKKKNDSGRLAAILILSLMIPLFVFVLSGLIGAPLNPGGQGASANVSSQQVLYTVPELETGGTVLVKESKVTPDMLFKGLAPILGLAAVSFFMLYLWRKYGGEVRISDLSDQKAIVIITVLALIIRGVSMVVANMYYAGPIFFGVQPEYFLTSIPLGTEWLFGPVQLPVWFLILFWNVIQGVIEMSFAWGIAFKFKFAEYYGSS